MTKGYLRDPHLWTVNRTAGDFYNMAFRYWKGNFRRPLCATACVIWEESLWRSFFITQHPSWYLCNWYSALLSLLSCLNRLRLWIRHCCRFLYADWGNFWRPLTVPNLQYCFCESGCLWYLWRIFVTVLLIYTTPLVCDICVWWYPWIRLYCRLWSTLLVFPCLNWLVLLPCCCALHRGVLRGCVSAHHLGASFTIGVEVAFHASCFDKEPLNCSSMCANCSLFELCFYAAILFSLCVSFCLRTQVACDQPQCLLCI